jgi:DNA helicase IV
MDRMWPSLSATEIVRDLLGVRAQLSRAGVGILSASEIDLLVRRGAGRLAEERWTRGDVALVDEAQWRIGGVPRTYSHVIVDEVQDLSPMEIRMIGRRASTGAMTLLGDLAQAIGEWSYPDWNALVAHLPEAAGHTVETLSIGYRVPRQLIELAAALLPRIAPGLTMPVSIRDGDAPTLVRTDASRLVADVVREMRARSKVDGAVGVIVPEGLRHAIEAGARAGRVEFDGADWGRGRKLTIMSAREAKGLEFDHVILVEPAALPAEGARGYRELYVALTRATKTLTVVAAEDLPADIRFAQR